MHIKIFHEGEKLIHCKQCSFTGLNPCEIQIHVAKVHKGKKSFKCYLCDYSSGYAGNLSSHVSSDIDFLIDFF